jgi:hypothetical protein
VQGANADASRLQAKALGDSEELNVNVAAVPVAPSTGPDVIVVFGATVSTVNVTGVHVTRPSESVAQTVTV